ncbi:hypothetical protein D3C76_1579630 [compost metagenome]
MAKTEQCLAVVDHGIRQLLGTGGLARLALQPQKQGEGPLRRTMGSGGHGCCAKLAVPLMPASKPWVSVGSSPISSSVWLPSSIRAPTRLTVAPSG